MPIDQQIQAWRRVRGFSSSALAEKAGVTQEDLAAIEDGGLDPSVSTLEALASALGVPVAWLHSDPTLLKLLMADPDDEQDDWLRSDSPDPITTRILEASRPHQDLYVLLTALLQHGEPKLLRAAEVNLRSLLKQAKTATVPWQSRPSGHFEPPNAVTTVLTSGQKPCGLRTSR